MKAPSTEQHNKKKSEKGNANMTIVDSTHSSDFIRNIIRGDLRTNKNDGRVVTRFPPEPNGYLHIGRSRVMTLGKLFGQI